MIATSTVTALPLSFSSQSVYNSPLPDVLETLVTDFKGFLKEQKGISDQYGKFSDTKLKEVQHKTAVQNQVRGLLAGSKCMGVNRTRG